MPTYLYENANGRIERVYPIGRAPNKVYVQGRAYHRVYCFNASSPSAWPHVSWALAVNPEDVAKVREFDRKHGVVTEYNKDGEPIFTSARHRKRYCEVHGFYDRNAGYSDPTPTNRATEVGNGKDSN